MGRRAHTGRVGSALALAGAVTAMVACGTTDKASQQTLPPMVTTTSTTTTTTTVPQDRFYTVERGDILAVIAAKYGVTVEAIQELNGIDNPDAIQAGQVLEIPPNVRTPVSDTTPAPETTAAP